MRSSPVMRSTVGQSVLLLLLLYVCVCVCVGLVVYVFQFTFKRRLVEKIDKNGRVNNLARSR